MPPLLVTLAFGFLGSQARTHQLTVPTNARVIPPLA